ncbi:MAG TPA: malonyl-CoA decarboxylase [Alphaproteobacteria bacterium]
MAQALSATRFLDRTWRNIRDAWRDIAVSARGVKPASFRPDLPDDDADRLREQMRDCLAARGGEVSARARAAELGRAYISLNREGRQRFLSILATEFDVDHEAVKAAAERLREVGTLDQLRSVEASLKRALEAPRVRLLTQFNALPEGTKFLVDLRADLIEFARGDKALAALEQDLKSLLAAWFDIGFLELKRITWDSPAALLEKLSRYEAVHAVRSWNDLKNRLDSDRRCFAFFHPRMEGEPLIFVEVALVNGLADNIATLLDESAPVGDPRAADTAIFYSISNAQKGLSGISFGGFLIKRVVDQLSAEFPRVKNFATLSPIPGFRTWLDAQFANGVPGMLTASERKALAATTEGVANKGTLKQLLATNWHEKPALAAALKGPLMRLCARYLVEAKRENGAALDPVANFHLSNGARIERICWLGDTSTKALKQSAGMMVNYLYRLADIEENHEAYVGERTVVASPAVTGLL